MAQFDLNRSNDTPIATLKLNEIAPVNWRRFPPRVANMTPAHVGTVTYAGGDFGDDVDEASANSTTPIAIRNQQDKATAMGVNLAVDITRPRGPIDPRQPYPVQGQAGPAFPVLTTVTPDTAAADTGPLILTVIGTGFTPWTIFRGAGRVNVLESRYQSPTVAQVMIDTDRVAPGVYALQAVDYDYETNTLPFTLT